ncbi:MULTISPECIES: hypothetical protein [Pantoea]|uniref:hypothetical protein n=1 Tax=Pantoea TaxID=53335 RepID=UPI000F5DC645|nr:MULTISPECIES: hypothetical protein [Pantoea]AZI53729.1 hypothetical protein CBF16_22940 [Pantoea agglomerans]MCW0976966.1 hypothetical protein [Pantoea sp. JV6]
MLGKKLTVPDLHALLRGTYPGYDPESLRIALSLVIIDLLNDDVVTCSKRYFIPQPAYTRGAQHT